MDNKPTLNEMISAFVSKALERYVANDNAFIVTDVYLQPNLHSGELNILNDDDEILLSTTVEEWKDLNGNEGIAKVESSLRGILANMQKNGALDNVTLMKPYSFVLIDEKKETLAELLLVDDQETLLIHDGLLNGLDEELDMFLKELLES